MENISPSVVKTLERCDNLCDDNIENDYKNYGNTLYSTNNKDKSEFNFSAYDASEDLHIIAPSRISKKPEGINYIYVYKYMYLCMCVCIHVYIYTCIYIFVCVHI
jgi:hypothetical protein